MGKGAVILSLTACGLCLLAGQSFSQAQAPQYEQDAQRRAQERKQLRDQRQEEFFRQREQQRLEVERSASAVQKARSEYSDEAYREAVGATPEQWKVIKPLWERVRSIESPPAIRVHVYAYSSRRMKNSTSVGNRPAARSSTGAGSTASGLITRDQSQLIADGEPGGFGQLPLGPRRLTPTRRTGPPKKRVGDVSVGWDWLRPSEKDDGSEPTAGEKTCERLLDALETGRPNLTVVRREVEAVREMRERIQAERREAQQQLREVVTPEQEARLILMGYLD
ncbi:MAG: hypothetical protein ABFE13_06830 [Phycisphaerales bacterium]